MSGMRREQAMSEPLKPIGCPICGGKPTINKGGPGDLVWYIACEKFDDHAVLVQWLGTRQQAIINWNTRKTTDALIDDLRAEGEHAAPKLAGEDLGSPASLSRE